MDEADATVLPDPATGRTVRRLAILLPLLLVVAAYARVLDAPFQYDDGNVIVANAKVRDPSRLAPSDFAPGRLARERPLATASFALDGVIGGGSSVPFHVTNILVHLAATLLAWRLGRRVLAAAGHPRAEALAVAAAGLFALHPIQTESVSYLAQRSESLASALGLGSILLLWRAEERWPTRGAWASLGGAVLALYLALGAKAMMVTAPVAWLLLRWAVTAPTPTGAWRRRMAVATPALLLAAAIGSSMLASLEGSADVGAGADLGAWPYLLTQARVVWRYLALLAWPSGLTIEHDVVPSHGLDAAVQAAAIGIALLVAGSLGARRLAARLPVGAERAALLAGGAGVLWFLLLLAPTSSVVPIVDLMFEHRAYLASWGVFLAFACGADWCVERLVAPRRRGAARGAVALLALVSLTIATWARNGVWTSEEALWQDAITKAPGLGRPRNNLGAAYQAAGEHTRALELYQQVIELARPGSDDWRIAHRNAGAALNSLGRLEDAQRVLAAALVRFPKDGELLNNLAVNRLFADDLEAATRWATAAVRAEPTADHFHTLGRILLVRGRADMALAALRRAVELSYEPAEILPDLAQAEEALGRLDDACRSWGRVAESSPDGAARDGARLRRGELGCR